jgi:hypothetical protein
MPLLSLEYRVDGWPLCPRCGEDELWSGKIPASAVDELSCYLCGWSGFVPAKAVVDYLEAHAELLLAWARAGLTRH